MTKLKMISLFAIIAAIVVFFSCRKDEGKFSCNEKAHQYALTHREENQSITRDSLVKLDRDIQFAVFRSLTPQNKKRIFNEKIDLLLATLSLRDNEKVHLMALKNYFEPSMYDSGEESPFLVQWASTAKNTLGWTDNMIQGMVGTWATPEELKTMGAKMNTIEFAGANSGCTCNYDISCAGIGDCKSGGCKTSSGGCGITGTANCKGNCPEDRIGPSLPGYSGTVSH